MGMQCYGYILLINGLVIMLLWQCSGQCLSVKETVVETEVTFQFLFPSGSACLMYKGRSYLPKKSGIPSRKGNSRPIPSGCFLRETAGNSQPES